MLVPTLYKKPIHRYENKMIVFCLLFSMFWLPVENKEKEILFMISGNLAVKAYETQALKDAIMETVNSISLDLDSSDTKMGVMWCKGKADFQIVSRMSERVIMEEKFRKYLGRKKTKQSTVSGLQGAMEFAKESVFSRSYYNTKIGFLLASTDIQMADATNSFKETCTGIISFVLLFPQFHQKCDDKRILEMIDNINEVQNSSRLLQQKRVMCIDEKTTQEDFGIKLAAAEKTNKDLIKHCIKLDFEKRKRSGSQKKALVNKAELDDKKDTGMSDENSNIVIGVAALISTFLGTIVIAVILVLVYKMSKRRANVPRITQTLAFEGVLTGSMTDSGSVITEHNQEKTKSKKKWERKYNDNLLTPEFVTKSSSTSKLTGNEVALEREMSAQNRHVRHKSVGDFQSMRTKSPRPSQRRKSCTPILRRQSTVISLPENAVNFTSKLTKNQRIPATNSSNLIGCQNSSQKKSLKYNTGCRKTISNRKKFNNFLKT